MEPEVANTLAADFETFFAMSEAGTIPPEAWWCSQMFVPPNGANTKTNRALLETLVNCLLIGKFKCRYMPQVRLGWTGRGYLVGLQMPPASPLQESPAESQPECID